MKKYLIILVVFAIVSGLIDAKAEGAKEIYISMNEAVVGNWWAQVDIPQNNLTIYMNFNLKVDGQGVVAVEWKGTDGRGRERSERGKVSYCVAGDKLKIEFESPEELIKTDHIFRMVNEYRFALEGDRLTIKDEPMFRHTDIVFGKGFENRGRAEIIFK